MMRCGENNHHVHDGYEEEMAPSSDVNDTDEDESNNSIVHEPFHKPSSENLSMDVSESECNIVNETLLQKNSADVPDNAIKEFKDEQHNKPSLTEKVTSYLTYSSVVEIYWINLTLHINGRSWYHQYERDTIHHQHERDTMINWRKASSIRTSEVTEL